MHAAGTRAVLKALSADGGAARFVGGAVRNALLGRKVDDVDIATPLLPGEVIRRLEASRIRAIPTGIAHGTVTAIADGRGFEVTTLRRDVETDGRHAVVAFSDSWAEDAARRDFTINALYASPDGEVFDYTGGLDDLEARRIRFIGDPVARIREDYLRILRLFRFHAWYGQGAMDEQARAAARKEQAGLEQLSGERLQKETLRLLEAENPVPSLRIMADDLILAHLIPTEPEKIRLDRIERLVAIDNDRGVPADPLLRLAALMPSDPNLAMTVAERLRLSSEDRNRLVGLAGSQEEIAPAMPGTALHKLLYRLGRQPARDRILLRWSEDVDESHGTGWGNLLDATKGWEKPTLPLTGRDILAAGVAEGPKVGAIFSKLEEAWIESDFTEDRRLLLERLHTMAQSLAD
jgi:poly(A) polymerase